MRAWQAGVESIRNSIHHKHQKNDFQTFTKDAVFLYAFLYFNRVSIRYSTILVCKLTAFTDTLPPGIQNKLACSLDIGHIHAVRKIKIRFRRIDHSCFQSRHYRV